MTGRTFSVVAAPTTKRDVDLFGPATVRIDARRTPDGAGVPMLYLSAYVTDHGAFAARVVAALEWLQDGKAPPVSSARTGEAPNKPSPDAAPQSPTAPCGVVYAMPEFVEDVDYSERLSLADPMTAEDWKRWAAAMTQRVGLAQDSLQIAALMAANDFGMKWCPPHHLAAVRKAVNDAYSVTYNQAAAA